MSNANQNNANRNLSPREQFDAAAASTNTFADGFHGSLRYRGEQALFHRGRRCDAQRMAVHAAFAKELPGL